VGELFPGVFSKNFEHIFTSFPEGKIQKYNIEIGGKSRKELKSELKENKIYVYKYANDLLDSSDFDTSKNSEKMVLVRLNVKDLGFGRGATVEELYERAQNYGLELCPAEVGPRLRLFYSGGDWMLIAMKQILDQADIPLIFYLHREVGELELDTYDALPQHRWRSDYPFVFRVRKS
jgi:hypothetical protein